MIQLWIRIAIHFFKKKTFRTQCILFEFQSMTDMEKLRTTNNNLSMEKEKLTKELEKVLHEYSPF